MCDIAPLSTKHFSDFVLSLSSAYGLDVVASLAIIATHFFFGVLHFMSFSSASVTCNTKGFFTSVISQTFGRRLAFSCHCLHHIVSYSTTSTMCRTYTLLTLSKMLTMFMLHVCYVTTQYTLIVRKATTVNYVVWRTNHCPRGLCRVCSPFLHSYNFWEVCEVSAGVADDAISMQILNK